MSNLGNYNKNSVWGNKPNISQNNALPPQLGALSNLNHSGIVPFQQHQQVFQNMGINQQNIGLGLQQMANNQLNASLASNPIFQQQLNAVSYPNPRALNPTAFQTQGPNSNLQNNSNPGNKQRVFTGTITQVHDNFGFIDDEVFFQRNVCVKGSNPVVGDRVLVEASFNPTMPFKWNATRVQVLQGNQHQPRDIRGGTAVGNSKSFGSNASGYNAVPPPMDSGNGFGRRGDNSRDFGRDRPKLSIGDRRNRSRDRDDDEIERKRRRDDRIKEREKDDKDRKSPVRRRSRSPKVRRRPRNIPRYMVQIPKIALYLPQADVLEIKRRYSNLYIPSDFFNTHIRWVDAFPPDKPYALNKPCSFHIMNKELEILHENDAILEPPDADYKFSAKVMLMSTPGIEEIYQKCFATAEDIDRRERDSEERDFIPVHPTRLINFLVGLRGKNETMAIGGPWSPSMDGESPESDPSVLIKTAIRTCKALTGIDLSNCTQWYRFVELYYRRSETTHKGKPVPARLETVVIFLPDVWSCLPTRLEWEGLLQSYRKQMEKILKTGSCEEGDDITSANDEKEEDVVSEKTEPTHYSQLDPKSMSVADLRNELRARNMSVKGLKSQLVARLGKALKTEAEKNGEETTDKENSEDVELETISEENSKKIEPEEKKLDEQQKRLVEKLYTLPDQPHLIVHPSKTAKSGKFDCTNMSLSLLLDYRPEDTKEHSFEVSLFAELFNEMLMRDFGFNIFKALYELPQKPKEKEEDKKKKDEKKKDKKDDDKRDKKDDERDKKSEDGDSRKDKDEDDKKRDFRDTKREDRKTNNSDEDEDDDMDDKKEKRIKDKKNKDKIKLLTKDKHLLLSFVYFDQTHCGYILDRDIEELLHTLGLNLSRSQARKLVSKVITRDSLQLHYRKLTDKPKDEEKDNCENKDGETLMDWNELALGNKGLLPVFRSELQQQDTSEKLNVDNGLTVYRGAVVDIGKLLSQLERSEKARIETEQQMVDLKNENAKLSEKYSKSNSTIKHLTSEMKEYKDKLRNAEDALSRANAHAKLFHTTLIDIRDKMDPVLKIASHKEKDERKDRDRDGDKKKQEDSKSRWEKDRDSIRRDNDKEIKKEHEKKEIKDKDIKEEVKKEIDDIKKEVVDIDSTLKE
ncbi:cell division cycle and apoptosis regulator protein 1-like [Rhynchophorus ferrugineus]|uniref:cell division cycle and apoptosis regulator protein 1-like n=1 Tax=Rhynchophorus ferrugineus TaxID=354439 RepID=UPI003FCD47DC